MIMWHSLSKDLLDLLATGLGNLTEEFEVKYINCSCMRPSVFLYSIVIKQKVK